MSNIEGDTDMSRFGNNGRLIMITLFISINMLYIHFIRPRFIDFVDGGFFLEPFWCSQSFETKVAVCQLIVV